VEARVTDEPLSLATLSRLVSRPAAGAIVSFQGTTREISRLDYEALPGVGGAADPRDPSRLPGSP
jgi:molybdopterin synthase catalytic subunit